MFVVEEAEDRTIPEDTIVHAVVKEVELKTVEYTDKKTKEDKSFKKVEWWFTVTAPEKYEGRRVKGETWPELDNSPGNQFRKWIETCLGKPLEVGAAVSPEDLVGLPVDMTVSHWTADDGRVFENVDELMTATKPGQDNDVPF